MKKNTFRTRIETVFFILIISYFGFNGYSQNIYVNDMDYVLGDVKQRFITGAVTTEAQADNLLKGFKAMRVNGIRIPIFPRDAITGVTVNPHPSIMKYFYDEAIAAGFDIFANPAQGGGGARIANNSLANGGGVNGNILKTNELVNRIIEFSNEYPDCKWLNPFNEDGRATNSTWSVNQINEIYERLYTHGLNGSKLIGPCTWGVPAGIDMLQNTNITDYIVVASSHNLGHHDGQWDDFMALADLVGLPVWDSEANNDPGTGTVNKVEAAIANKVDGLVVYNSGNNINLSNGSLSATNEYYMSQYLKPLVNLALEGTASQSSTNPTWGMEASRAIDGDVNGRFSAGNGSMSLTSIQQNAWWELDLGSIKTIGDIKIWNRVDENIENMSNFNVTVSNVSGGLPTFSTTVVDAPRPTVIIESDGTSGRFIKIQLNSNVALAIGEVQVFAEGNPVLSTREIEDNNVKISMYPNPVNDKLTVVTRNANFNSYALYNMNGQMILTNKVERNVSALEINVSELSRGFYVLKLNGDNFSGTYKVVKD